MDYIEIGSAPACEDCAQVGSDDYAVRSRRECAVFIRMLERVFPVPAGLIVRFRTKSFPHDFGTYREVVVEYEGGREALDFALKVESETPDKWDDIAHFELHWHEQRAVYDCAVREGRLTRDDMPECLKATAPPTVPPTSTFTELLHAYRL